MGLRFKVFYGYSAFGEIIEKYRAYSFSERDKGGRFERLMQAFLKTYPVYNIEVIGKVQKAINRAKKDSFIFDLIICDEAHRTTGVTLSDDDKSDFVKVHDNDFRKSKKRMYMTATLRLYSESAKGKAKEVNVELCSMDDAELYGGEMYRIGFGEAVDNHLLSDYKVIVLTIDEKQMSGKLKKSIEDRNKEIDAEAALKIIGCINALSKKSLSDDEIFKDVDPATMRSAVAFCQNIAILKATKDAFNDCREAYFETLSDARRREIVIAEAGHVDGTMGALEREKRLACLKSRRPAAASAGYSTTAGRALAELHLNYEEQERPAGVKVEGEDKQNFLINQMKFPAKGQKDTIIYNNAITISNIPAAAYGYAVNGKPAIEWVMERYAVTTHKESGIRNALNDWAREHNAPRYILDLLLSVINVVADG